MLDRTTPPDAKDISQIHIPQLQRHTLPNGVRLFVLADDSIEVFSIKIIVHAGILTEGKPLSATFYQRWVQEGDKELLTLFEQNGFSFSAQAAANYVEYSVAGLSDWIQTALELLKRLFEAEHLDPKEFEQIKQIALENYKVSIQKTSFKASTTLRAKLFGERHPLSHHVCPELLEDLTLQDLLDFQNNGLKQRPFDLLLIGKFPDDFTEKITQTFGQSQLKNHDNACSLDYPISAAQKIFIPISHAQQASIAMGKKVCSRKDKDYFSLLVLNEVLGGYFGSRLMRRLREKEGLTYGIYSQLSFTKNTGNLYIMADLNRENLNRAIELIYQEISDLQNNPVPSEELQTVKKHISGSLLRSVASLFSVGSSLYFSVFNELGEEHLTRTLQEVQQMDAQKLQHCANKYLSQNWIEVSCG